MYTLGHHRAGKAETDRCGWLLGSQTGLLGEVKTLSQKTVFKVPEDDARSPPLGSTYMYTHA